MASPLDNDLINVLDLRQQYEGTHSMKEKRLLQPCIDATEDLDEDTDLIKEGYFFNEYAREFFLDYEGAYSSGLNTVDFDMFPYADIDWDAATKFVIKEHEFEKVKISGTTFYYRDGYTGVL